MTLAAGIAPHLPYLRRFSRALSGDQHSGDAYVAALLEAVIADPPAFTQAPDLKVALYRGFCKLWESLAVNMQKETSGPDWEVSAKRHLSTLPPRAREAFLLMAVEGFSKVDIGHIMSKTPVDIENLIDEASRAIMAGVATDVMIIEDEPIIAMDLEGIMESLGHRVTGIARTEAEALRLATAKRPGLVLADIQLADGSSGIETVNKLLRNFNVPVVFITAFPERLLTGDKPEPAFLITKPFLPEMVKAVVSQALFFDTKSQAAA